MSQITNVKTINPDSIDMYMIDPCNNSTTIYGISLDTSSDTIYLSRAFLRILHMSRMKLYPADINWDSLDYIKWYDVITYDGNWNLWNPFIQDIYISTPETDLIMLSEKLTMALNMTVSIINPNNTSMVNALVKANIILTPDNSNIFYKLPYDKYAWFIRNDSIVKFITYDELSKLSNISGATNLLLLQHGRI